MRLKPLLSRRQHRWEKNEIVRGEDALGKQAPVAKGLEGPWQNHGSHSYPGGVLRRPLFPSPDAVIRHASSEVEVKRHEYHNIVQRGSVRETPVRDRAPATLSCLLHHPASFVQ